MHKGKYVFSQLLDFLDRNGFNYLSGKKKRWRQVCQASHLLQSAGSS